MSAESALLAGRAAAERLMVATVRITRTDRSTRDPLTGLGTPTTVYEGRAKVQTYEPHEVGRDSAGSTQIVQRYHVHVPVDSGPFEVGDLVHILTSPLMPHAVGDRFRVAGLHEKSLQTAQRLLVDEFVNSKG